MAHDVRNSNGDDRKPASMDRPISRRTLLQSAGLLGAAGVAAPLLANVEALASTPRRATAGTPIQHVIVDMQENRSFDHDFGFAPFVGSSGVPPGYSQPDGQARSVPPYHLTR